MVLPDRWKDRADNIISQGGLTNSKWRESLINGLYPTHIKSATECYIYDTNNKRYTDFICGLGSNLFGYGNQKITDAVIKQLYNGVNHSLPTIHEVECGEKLKELIPFIDRVKWLKTGSDACTAAIKFARAYQGVRDGNSGMQYLLQDEDYIGFFQKSWEAEKRMQGMLQDEIHKYASRYGEKENGCSEIQENGEGSNLHEKLSENGSRENGSSKISGKIEAHGENSCQIQNKICSYKWEDRKNALRDLWVKKCGGASRRLHETPRGEMALSKTSRGNSPKWLILSDAYHGFHDIFTSLSQPAKGIPFDPGVLPLQGNEDLIPIAAAVIIEPVITDYSKERIAWLKWLREETKKHDCILIHDEVINCLRWEKYSVSQRYKIIPDLICLGKAVGGGWSLAGVAGRADILDDKEVFISSTYAGETAPLIAGKTAMELLQRDSNYNMDELWRSGQEFIDKFNEMGGVQITGYPTRGSFVGTLEDRALFCQEAAISGLLFHPSTWFYNFPHMKVSYDALNIIEAIKTKIRLGRAKLNYPLPTTPFAAKLREKS